MQDMPDTLTQLISDDDRVAIAGGDVNKAVKAVERVATAAQKVREVYELPIEERKRQALSVPVESKKRKKHKAQHPLVSQPSADENGVMTDLVGEPLPLFDHAHIASLLSTASSIATLYGLSVSLFEWSNGPLITTMQSGNLLLLDEISLADDAVLERLNSVLEPERSLLLAEKGDNSATIITAQPGFHVFGTMNPGGDFGKKELSPALRNRMTEVWVEAVEKRDDMLEIVQQRMAGCGTEAEVTEWSDKLVTFVWWYNATQTNRKRHLSLRDVLAWVAFVAHLCRRDGRAMSMEEAYLNGACLTLLDGLGIGSSDSEQQVGELKRRCIECIIQQTHIDRQQRYLNSLFPLQCSPHANDTPMLAPVVSTDSHFGMEPFVIGRGPLPAVHVQYSFASPTPHSNLQRVLRALHLPRAVLLEGSPGVGKCFARGTQLRLYDGRLCAVEDVVAGMQLMGDDGLHRVVKDGSFTHGKAGMYCVRPQWEGATAFTVNSAHVLVLINTTEPSVVRVKSCNGDNHWAVERYEVDGWDNIMRLQQRRFANEKAARVECEQLLLDWQPVEWEVSVEDFLSTRVDAKVYSACHLFAAPAITFHSSDHQSLEHRLSILFGRSASNEQVDWAAWLLGLWLSCGLEGQHSIRCAVADGESGQRLSTALLDYSQHFHEPVTMREDEDASCLFTFGTAASCSFASRLFDSYGLCQLPRSLSWEQSVLCESVTVRRAMLAGCMDGCGSYDEEGATCVLTTRMADSATDIKLLAASLGLRNGPINQQQPHSIYTTVAAGDLSSVLRHSRTMHQLIPRTVCSPQRVTYPFSIDVVGEADYFGFAVEGGPNRRFLLADFTVTHNSSLIQSLAAASSHQLTRIQLSEQTDMMDLLGVDLPVEGEKPGTFRWSDGVFLQAMKAGHWVLLDELNLASQSVLEGLNAVLDHRSEMFIPELGQTIHSPASFRVFAAQNPMQQGGGRRGLPASFLNRFTKVQLDVLSREDLLCVGRAVWSGVRASVMERMVAFNQLVYDDVVVRGEYGKRGGPWEFNLRDIGRWCDLIDRAHTLPSAIMAQGDETAAGDALMRDDREEEQAEEVDAMARFVDLVYLQRMRTQEDRDAITTRYQQVFGRPLHIDRFPNLSISSSWLRVGDCFLSRVTDAPLPAVAELSTLHSSMSALSQLMQCVDMSYPVLLIGETSTGKSSLVHTLAALTGHPLAVIDVNESMDSSDLLGCFEQIDIGRHTKQLIRNATDCVNRVTSQLLAQQGRRAMNESSVKVEPKTEVADGKGKRKLPVREGKANKKHKHSVIGSITIRRDGGSADTTDTSVLDTVTSIYQQLEAVIHQRRSVEAEKAARLTAVSFTQEQHAALATLLQLLASLVSSHAIALPAHLKPSFLLAHLDRLIALSSSPAAILGTFQWLDGSLLHALEHGHWLLMENINYCSASVLDRLNGLLERGGVLMVNECGLRDGQVRVVRPHPGFRLFGTMNEQYGQVSRAMRNRCIEIALLDTIGQQPSNTCDTAVVVGGSGDEELAVPSAVVGAMQRDLIVLCNACGVEGDGIPSFLVSLHGHVCRTYQRSMLSVLPSPTVRHLQQWCALLSQQLYSGASVSLVDALLLTFRHAYPMAELSTDHLLQSTFSASLKSLAVHSRESLTLDSPWAWPARLSLFSPLSSARTWSLERSSAVFRYLATRWDESLMTTSEANDSLVASEAPSAIVDVRLPSLTRPTVALTTAERCTLPVTSALVPAFAISSHPAHPVPSVPHLFRIALLHFIAHSSPTDWQVRVLLLRHLNAQPHVLLEAQRGIRVLTSLHQHPIFPTLKERQHLAEAMGITMDYLSSQSLLAAILPRRAWLLLTEQQRLQMRARQSLVPFVVLCSYRALVESEAYKAVDSGHVSVATRSPIQQSYTHHSKQEHARHNLLIPLYPLFAHYIDPALQQLFASLVSSPTAGMQPLLLQVQTLLERRNWLWDTLHLSRLQKRTDDGRLLVDDEAIRIRWHGLQKAVKLLRVVLPAHLNDHMSDSLDSLSTYLASLHALLHPDSVAATRAMGKNVLYKRAGHPALPRSQRLGELQHELYALDKRLQWSPTDADAFWVADGAVKNTLLEALCNIRYIVCLSAEQQSSHDVERLTAQLNQLPQRLNERLDTLTAEASKRHSREHYSVQLLSGDEESLEEMGLNEFQRAEGEAEGKDGDAALPAGLVIDVRTERSTSKRSRASLEDLLPVTDMYGVSAQHDVLACLAALVCLLFTQRLGASEVLQSSDESQLSLAPLSTRVLARLPSLVSFSSAYTSASPSSLAPFQSSLWLLERLQPMLANKQAISSWSAEALVLLSALPSLLADVLHSHFHLLHRSSITSSSTLGSASLLTPRLSMFVTSLVSRASSVSLIDRHTKRMQVSLLVDAIVDHTSKQQLSTGDIDGTERQERVLAVSQLTLMVACYRKYFAADDFSIVLGFSQPALLFAVSNDAAHLSSLPPLFVFMEALSRCTDTRFTALVSSHLLPAWELAASPGLSPLQLARLSLFTALSRTILYLPASPVDASRAHMLALTDTHYYWSSVLQRMQYKQWADSTASRCSDREDEHWALMSADKREKEASHATRESQSDGETCWCCAFRQPVRGAAPLRRTLRPQRARPARQS